MASGPFFCGLTWCEVKSGYRPPGGSHSLDVQVLSDILSHVNGTQKGRLVWH
jgi:hypothetical protein